MTGFGVCSYAGCCSCYRARLALLLCRRGLFFECTPPAVQTYLRHCPYKQPQCNLTAALCSVNL
eukprot:357405-Chlamydomonas_euryale.AAC.3